MNGRSGGSPMQKVLVTSLVPVLAIVGSLGLVSFLRSQDHKSPQAAAAPSAQTRARDLRDTSRQAYRDCLKEMGGDFGRPRIRGRFSVPPDMKKIREAMSVCRSLLEGGGAAPAAPRGPATPPIA